MKLFYLPILLLLVLFCGCTKPPSTAQIFSNAQVQYQTKDQSALVRKRDMEMPSYYFEMLYEPKQIALNSSQEKKIEAILKKLVYPEEYQLYVSFGTGQTNNLSHLNPVLKRAEFIKTKYGANFKAVKIAYLKNQTRDSAYFRLIT